MGATYIPNYISMENCWSNLTNKHKHTHTLTLNPKLSSVSVYIVGTRCEGELKVDSVSELKKKKERRLTFSYGITMKY